MKFITFTKDFLGEEHIQVLRALGREIGVKSPTSKNKANIIEHILAIQSGKLQPAEPSKRGAPVLIEVDLSKFYAKGGNVPYEHTGIDVKLELSDSEKDQFITDGFIEIDPLEKTGVMHVSNYEQGQLKVTVPAEKVTEYGLRQGDQISATVKKIYKNQPPVLQEVLSINEVSIEEIGNRPLFESFSACNPTEKFVLEKDGDLSLRVLDLFVPIGKGQRGLVVSQPKSGGTTLLIKIANAIALKNDVKLFVLLVDYRPEEITDIEHDCVGEVRSSSFDESYQNHVKVADLCINKAKRLAESGKDAVVIVDSITALAKAYANVYPTSEGVVSAQAMQSIKAFFGCGKNLNGAGSLTLLATATDTQNVFYQTVLQELEEVCNMQVYLDYNLAKKGVYPAIDLLKSSTKKSDSLLTAQELSAYRKLYEQIIDDPQSTQRLLEALKQTQDNQSLVEKINAK